MAPFRRVIVLGLDGFDPSITDALMARGALPHLIRLAASGGYARLATTYPAQTPVAWSTFATGRNPGGHGIYDFLNRNPRTHAPDISLTRYETRGRFLPPRVVNLRGGVPFWDHLSEAGILSVVLRCPCTYPPASLRGRLLAGLGVPDLRGGFGVPTFFTDRVGERARESEELVPVRREGTRVRTHLPGPRRAAGQDQAVVAIEVAWEPGGERATLHSSGTPGELPLPLRQWSDWLRIKFRLGPLQRVSGIVRFFLAELEPAFELYASPINFDPLTPLFPISAPWDYAGRIVRRQGFFYTAGMVEDHTGLGNGRLDEQAFLDQCAIVMRERERMLRDELDRSDEGFVFCLFDTPDRIQHMFWRFREPDHPANRTGWSQRYAETIEEHYRECDALVGRVLAGAGDRTLVIVASDHGFASFRRGVNLNAWLREHGFLAVRSDCAPDGDGADLLQAVDWERTRAYALGLAGIYLNLRDREGRGIVAPDEAASLKRAIATGLTALRDPAAPGQVIRSVCDAQRIYRGPFVDRAPDLIVNFSPGYRASWATAMGGIGGPLVEDNGRRWSGDHVVDPAAVPGILFMNRRFRPEAHLVDLGPTVLQALGVPVPADYEGRPLLLEDA